VATVTVLRAPALSATTGTTLGSQAIDPLTGLSPHPHTRMIVPDASAGTYTVNVPNASAVMVTMQSTNLRPREWPAVHPIST
jgi:H+/gluconate symporter-like permease